MTTAARQANAVKTHLLVKLPKQFLGIEYRAKCQHAFRFDTGKQLRGTLNPSEVTCAKCNGRSEK